MWLTDPLCAVWMIGTIVIILVGFWLCEMSNTVPTYVIPLLIYGKASNDWVKSRFTSWLQVPKKWFIHFYVFAVAQNVIALCLMCGAYFFSTPIPNDVSQLLYFLTPSSQASVSPVSALLAMSFIFFHTSRRLYECMFVSVYSPSYMAVIHYLLGYMFYYGVTMTLLTEAPGFKSFDVPGQLGSVSWFHIVGTVLFIYGSYHHHKTHVTFANLRKDAKGAVVTTQHFMPSGGLFNLVSCPHYFAEIVIYLALAIVLELRHTSWWLVFAWTLAGQSVTALMTHRWYQEKYKEYPKNRRAVIPFLL